MESQTRERKATQWSSKEARHAALVEKEIKLLLDRKEVPIDKHHANKLRVAVIKEILKEDHYPLTWAEERIISNNCKISREYLNKMSKVLIASGWKPKNKKEGMKLHLTP